jgi:dTDP-4-amino-4,6-dideoxygalactose transaminase
MIRMNDFSADPLALREAQKAAAQRVLDSGWYILGSEVQAFEAQFAAACGVRHAIGVANGLDAIEIALRALGIGPGDEVITTPMTAFATVLGILRAGATPRLADIDERTAQLAIDSVERCINERTRAILLVHLYGHVTAMDSWLELARSRNLHLIEDCAQAHLAKWRGQVAGTLGVCGAYSFYPTKNLGAPGDAGALITGSDDLAELSRSLRNYGQTQRYHHPNIGLNSRLDELHAAILAERLRFLAGFTERRRAIAGAYRGGIREGAVRLMAAPQAAENHVHHLFVVTCDRRAALAEHLKSQGVESFSHYPVPVHFQKSCGDIARDPRGLPAAERHAEVCLSIPCHHNLSDADVARVIEAVNAFA